MAVTVKFYPEGQLIEPLSRAIRTAKRSVDMVYFYWKTQYATFTPANAIVKAAQDAARKEGVRVRVLLGYGADAPSVQYLNYLTAKALAESGIEVRLAPVSRTTHVKMTVIDTHQTFLGSHNLTRGALTDNAEASALIRDTAFGNLAQEYFNRLWQTGTPLDQVAPPPPPVTSDDSGSGYYPPPLAPPLTARTEQGSQAAILEWTAASAVFFSRYELHRDIKPNLTEESPLLASIPLPGLTRYLDTTRNPALPAYYRLYLFNTEGAFDGSAEVFLPATQTPVITLNNVTNENDALVCGFTVDSRQGITAIAALSSPNANLSNPTKGPEFGSTVSQAWVHPVANAGDTVYVAVAAYADGIEIARSNIVQTTYQPVTAPPPTLTAPQLVSVTQTGAMGINVEYSHVTPAEFARYEVQQGTMTGLPDNGMSWQTLATIMDGTARSWDGAPNVMDTTHPIRVVVFDTGSQSAASNEVAITLLPSLAAPVLTTLYRVGAMGLHVDWTHPGVTDFARFELQQRQTDGVTWTAFATMTDPTVRSWEVDFVPYRDGTHPVRVVVFDTFGRSAASNEVSIGGPDAPHIESVATASGTTVRVQWTWSGQDFQSYLVQQQDAQLTWHDLAQIFAQSTMQWTGAPTVMQGGRPFRVVVNAGAPSPVAVNSNEVSLIAGPPPAPVLGVITPAPLPTVHVPWTWTGALNFQRFVVQQRNGAMVWQDLATITNPATVEWTGQMLPTGQAWPFRIVVYLTTGESATSAEGYITQT